MAFTLAWPRIFSFRDCNRAMLPITTPSSEIITPASLLTPRGCSGRGEAGSRFDSLAQLRFPPESQAQGNPAKSGFHAFRKLLFELLDLGRDHELAVGLRAIVVEIFL